MFSRVVSLLAALVTTAAFGAPPLPVIPSNRFLVTSYGAVADGSTDNTAAFQAALNAAKNAGGGTVEVPAGAQAYRCGPITISSSTNFQVDSGATVQALPFATYPNATTSPAHFITIATNSTQVEISGGGTIDGNGSDWWNAYNAKTISNRPRLIQVNHADTVLLTGITLTNSPMFHCAFSATNNVTIDGVTITAPESAPNSDALDPAGQHYLITNCTISVGDDNVAVKAGSTFCGDIVITHCTFGTGHGVSVGGQTNAGLDGMLVDHCTFNGTTTALRLKADPTQGGPVQNVTYSNLTLTNVPYPFVFYSYYADVGTPGAVSGSNQTTPAKVANWNANPPDSLRSSTLSTWKNITLTNITATGSTGYSVIWGLPLANALVANVTLNNVQISGAKGLEVYNAQNVQFTGNTTFTTTGGAPSLTTYNAAVITGQPQPQAVPVGGTATFSVTTAGTGGISGPAPAYLWLFNGAPLTDGTLPDGAVISGSTSATLTIANARSAEGGVYSTRVTSALDTYDSTVTNLVASNTTVTATSGTAILTVNDLSGPAAWLTNLSVRTTMVANQNPLIVGLKVKGGPKSILLRAAGPGLGALLQMSSGTMVDPRLSLFDRLGATSPVSSNDNWDPSLAATFPALGAFPFPNGSADAAYICSLDNTHDYTVQLPATGPGMVIVEAYDVNYPSSSPRMWNISARNRVGVGDDVLIEGFHISGTGTKRLLIRAVGPTLTNFSVPGVLADPLLEVRDTTSNHTLLATNNDWDASLTATFDLVGAFHLNPGSKDAAAVVELAAGASYTVVAKGADGGTGEALVEVYELP